ncbi:extracellular solute-binding protein [Williamsia sterculiae]|uniref:Carbohydrate ABC transporter substrate-binding protein, CUT1 family n=1 Tax=Williamsia sterculiae TaxID=1344003 RepID=A0A1N7E0W9_9NOCA|nr:extracellular solute-binding protein [Williamsia sterculiae]SIR81713.1 carbohydrate ABC transporter substrate-binding protein, CUT1 family [Williamsia sterculiae]
MQSRYGVQSVKGSRPRGRIALAAVAAAAVLPLVSACGSDSSRGTINIYPPADGAKFIEQAAQTCSANSGGKYKIVTHPLPKAADDQRLQLARRLAGNDHSLDLMGMDVVWTAEFADAGWVAKVPDALAAKVKKDTLGGPLETALWKTKDDKDKTLYAIPTWTNTQLLWFRPDVLKKYTGSATPPQTWDQLLAENKKITAAGGPSYVMVQGKQYEGLMVWFNSVLASAGGQVVDPDDASKQTLNDTPEHRAATVKALQILKAVATAPGHDPSITNSDESAARLGMENGSATFEINYPFVFPSMRSNAAAGDVAFFPEMAQKYGKLLGDPDNSPPDKELGPANNLVRTKFDFGLYPGVKQGERPRSTPGGVNIAVASTSQQKDLAFTAAQCLTDTDSQRLYAVSGGTPPTLASLYADADFKAAYPMGEKIKEQLESGVAAPRPASPQYQAISTLLTAKLSPVGSWDPNTLVDQLADVVNAAIDGKGLIP